MAATSTDSASQWHNTHLVVTVPIPEQERVVAKLKQTLGVRVTWIEVTFKVDDPSIYADADLIMTVFAMPESRAQCPKLKYCHIAAAGIDHFSGHPLFGNPEIRWTYASGIHGPPMAEWLFMTYCAFEKQYDMYREEQRNRLYGLHFKAMRVRDLYGQRLGIVGYGSIGRQIARVADAMGMEVLAFTATPKETPESRREGNRYRLPGTGDPEGVIPKEWYSGLDKQSVHHFLRQGIDLLVLSMPLTEESRGLLGREEFEILKKHSPVGGAFIANLARGEVINQDELIEALKTEASGVRGAALDVVVPEPLPPESPLWDAPNCWITPHNSSQNNRYMERAVDIMLQNLQKPWEIETKFINEVQIDRGY